MLVITNPTVMHILWGSRYINSWLWTCIYHNEQWTSNRFRLFKCTANFYLWPQRFIFIEYARCGAARCHIWCERILSHPSSVSCRCALSDVLLLETNEQLHNVVVRCVRPPCRSVSQWRMFVGHNARRFDNKGRATRSLGARLVTRLHATRRSPARRSDRPA